ncbi:MAG: GNAT family N-acetyltransferase [Pseudonocardiales bacterium]|nr:GNAT family N-acetyltransferase [Pseudonocardiales bacterium]
MNAGRSPLFCDTALAERIERIEAQLVAKGSEAAHHRAVDSVGFVIPVAGGVASFAEEGSPLNKVAGLGFGGVPTVAALDEEDEFGSWLNVVADGFAHPDTQGVPAHEEFPREVVARAMRNLTAAAGVMRYVALRDGVLAGGAGFRVAQGVAQLTGAATAPAHRRRGVQTALLSARLADAAAADCDIAVITTQPGSKSQQNAQRRGFDLLYTRAILVKFPDQNALSGGKPPHDHAG